MKKIGIGLLVVFVLTIVVSGVVFAQSENPPQAHWQNPPGGRGARNLP